MVTVQKKVIQARSFFTQNQSFYFFFLTHVNWLWPNIILKIPLVRQFIRFFSIILVEHLAPVMKNIFSKKAINRNQLRFISFVNLKFEKQKR